jgi:nucleoid-associated protein YgaU
MGKETKIGLAVIAVLMTVFGVLLFRHLQASHTEPTRGLGDQTAVKPLPAHSDVKVASDESRITGSKLWDTPGEKAEAGTVEVAGAETTDPYQRSAEESDPPAMHSPFQGHTAATADAEAAGLAADRENRNPLRQASAEVPLDSSETPAAEGPDSLDAQQAIADPLMTVPSTNPVTAGATGAADPYANSADEIPQATEQVEPIDQPLPGGQLPPAQNHDERTPASAAMRSPFSQAPPVETAPAAQEAANRAEPDWAASEPAAAEPQAAFAPQQPGGAPAPAEPTGAFAPQPAAGPSYDAEPQPADAPYDRFEAAAAEPTSTTESQATGTPADGWQTTAPAAAPLTADSMEAAPLPIEDGLYTVQPGDSLWTVSEAVYGTGGYFKALAAHNQAALPQSDKLTVGSQLSVPPVADLQRDYPSLCPRPRKSAVVRAGATRASAVEPRSGRDVYIVNEGDTLFTIARYELGKATRWAEIYDLNREALGEDFDYLRPGMELVMPARGTEAASQPADSRY